MALKIYKNGTTGAQDGTELTQTPSELIPTIAHIGEIASVSQVQESPEAQLHARDDTGLPWTQVLVTPVNDVLNHPDELNADHWALAPDEGGVAGAYEWAGTVNLGEVAGVNVPFWRKAKYTPGEREGKHIETDLWIRGVRPQLFLPFGPTEEQGWLPGLYSLPGGGGRISGWFVYDSATLPDPIDVRGTWALVGSKWYVFAGCGDPYGGVCHFYDILAKTWTAGGTLPTPPGGRPSRPIPLLAEDAAPVDGTDVYLCPFVEYGGDYFPLAFYRYDTLTDTAVYLDHDPFTVPFEVRSPVFLWQVGTTLFVYWQRLVPSMTEGIWSYDLVSGVWNAVPLPMPPVLLGMSGGYNFTHVPDPGGVLHYFISATTTPRLHADTGVWDTLPAGPGKSGAGGILGDGKLYAISPAVEALTARYDGSRWATDTWSTFPRFPTAQSEHTAPFVVFDPGEGNGLELFAMGGTDVFNQRVVNHYYL